LQAAQSPENTGFLGNVDNVEIVDRKYKARKIKALRNKEIHKDFCRI